MGIIASVVGVLLVVGATVDMVNTLVTTSTSQHRYWLTQLYYRRTWQVVRAIGRRIKSPIVRERFLGGFAPVSVLGLLTFWVTQQIVGFGLLWWGLGGVANSASLGDTLYYSGVVFFTLGFGDIVPVAGVPRFGALVEAFAGVMTTALVIGYLPALYGAYSERERMLATLDDGTDERITPANLLCARAPSADIADLLGFFEKWESWVAGILETHSSYPMLVLFRSKHVGQSWITALGLVSDAALHCQMIEGAQDRSPYWMLRRSITLFDELTYTRDLDRYRPEIDELYEHTHLFSEIYEQLDAHGFDLLPHDEALALVKDLRLRFDAALESMLDELLAPSGFWGHGRGRRLGPTAGVPIPDSNAPEVDPRPPVEGPAT